MLNNLRAALRAQGSLADDPAVDEATSALVDAIGPALQMVAMDFAQQAADEVRAQLAGHSVDVLVVDGDPTLRVTEATAAADDPPAEELDARITLRLPPTLKRLIEDAAVVDGDSVNTWVVDALAKRTNRTRGGNHRVTEGFDL